MSRISILVTGASTGIGRAIAIDLAAQGHQVFATVRKKEDAVSLEDEAPSLHALVADVTDQAAVERAAAEISELRDKSWPFCLVNNAGIAVGGPVETLPLEMWQKQFDVNFFGAVRMTRTFLPIIRETRGRIVNMSSVSGLVAAPLLAPYAASKFALEAFSDSLRREVGRFGVKVIVVEPGAIKTPIWQKGLKQEIEVTSEYEGALEVLKAALAQSEKEALPVERVVNVVREALTEQRPPTRKLVATLPVEAAVRLANLLPGQVSDFLIGLGAFGKKSKGQ